MTFSILFNKRHTINLEKTEFIYDPHKQINMLEIDGELKPAVDQSLQLPTNSKTLAAPGDDDPDPDNELLY